MILLTTETRRAQRELYSCPIGRRRSGKRSQPCGHDLVTGWLLCQRLDPGSRVFAGGGGSFPWPSSPGQGKNTLLRVLCASVVNLQSKMPMDLSTITDTLLDALRPLRFGPPVTHVYNPLEYARKSYDLYLKLYASHPKEIILLGMNPGPWGMAQTGVPFGEVTTVKEWLRIQASVGTPAEMHPKRPVQGFTCQKSEVSGRRLWGWAQETFVKPEQFFARFFVINYCPLLFIESSGRNRTPNNLRIAERKPLLEACDQALRQTIQWFRPRYVVGVGRFAGERAHAALTGLEVTIGIITHPSPANPKANRGWDSLVMKELRDLGIRVKA